MGNSITWISNKLFGKDKKRILMVGLDGTGKTTILYRLKLGKKVETSPTNCFNVEAFEHGLNIIEVWDISGNWTIRTHFYSNTDGVIFVMDVTDKNRMDKVNASLYETMSQAELKKAPLLILANKIDSQQNEFSANEIIKQIDLTKLKSANISLKFFVQKTSAITGDGLLEGMDWLCTAMDQNE